MYYIAHAMEKRRGFFKGKSDWLERHGCDFCQSVPPITLYSSAVFESDSHQATDSLNESESSCEGDSFLFNQVHTHRSFCKRLKLFEALS